MNILKELREAWRTLLGQTNDPVFISAKGFGPMPKNKSMGRMRLLRWALIRLLAGRDGIALNLRVMGGLEVRRPSMIEHCLFLGDDPWAHIPIEKQGVDQ